MVFRETPVLTALLGKLGLMVGREPDRDAKKAVPEPQRADGTDPQVEAFSKQIDAVLGRHKTAVHDRTFLISLDKVRDKLGPKWDSVREKVHDTVRAIIEHHLTPHDLYTQYDDLSFLVVLSGREAKEAQLRCTLISEEILRRLVGRQTAAQVIDIKVVRMSEDRNLRFDDLPAIDTLLSDYFLANNARDGTKAPKPDRARSVKPVAGGADDTDPRPKKPTGGRQADKVLGLFESEFIFRPLLAVRTKVVSTFMCIPVRARRGGYVSGYEVLGDPSEPRHVLELDMLTMNHAADALRMLQQTRKRSLMALPVHFETLADSGRRARYVSQCANLFSATANRVVFEIVGLPDGIPQARLVDLASALRPNCRAVMARFDLEHTSFPAFRTAGLHAVGVDVYSTEKNETTVMAQLDRFIDSAKRNQLRTYVLGVRSISLYTVAVTAGVDYLAGYALTAVARSAEDVYAFRLDMPYMALLEASTTP